MELREKMRWIFYSDLLQDEYTQCKREGRDVADLKAEVEAVLAMHSSQEKEDKSRALILQMENRVVLHNCNLHEPSTYAQIISLLPDSYQQNYPYDEHMLAQKVKGAWYGRLSGCMLGIPVESWTRERIHGYIKESGAWPLQNYMTGKVADEVRAKYGVEDYDPGTPYDRQTTCWIEFLKGYPVDDDVNYMMLALKVIERFGKGFTAENMAETWLFSMAAFQACTAERVAYRNLLNGKLPPECAVYGNPFREWVGAQIRGDVFGYVVPGNPHLAAKMAFEDASISHVKNGIYGEMFVAALISLCYCDMPMKERVCIALEQIPPNSRAYQAIVDVLYAYENGKSFHQQVEDVHSLYNEKEFFDWCYVIPNLMLVVINVLYWQNDFEAAITQTVLSGFDTDCNGATVGSIVGLALGFDTIPLKWYADIEQTVASGIHGFSSMCLEELISKTLCLIPY